MTPSEIDAMADTDAAQVPVKPLLLAMANTYQVCASCFSRSGHVLRAADWAPGKS